MKSCEIMIAYEGEINHEIMKSFTNLAIKDMTLVSEKDLTQKKVYHVMVECLQNIAKHAFHNISDRPEKLKKSVLLLVRSPVYYNIITGNIIGKSRKNYLTQLLEKINILNNEELNELFKRQLKEGHLSEKGGAGLGFIDIKRKIKNDLEYHFFPVNDHYSFFLFSSKIDR